MKGPLISIIVPVYNVEAYLPRCVESLCNQTYRNLEIVLVDDGATDKSGALCDEYAAKDERIRVIHKENGGLSDARNAALDIMTGEYVTCVDSDDFVSSRYIENLYSALEMSGAQIATSWFLDYFEGDAIPTVMEVEKEKLLVLNREETFRKLLYQDGVEGSAWGKLVKSTFYDGVRYPKGKIYEDIVTTYKLIEKAEKIAVIPNVDYYYYHRSNSIALETFHLRKMDCIEHMNELKSFITEKYPNLCIAAECRYFSSVCNILFLIKKNEFDKEREFLWGEIEKYRKTVLKDRNGRKKARFAAAISYMGYPCMKRIYSLVKRST